MNNEIFYYEEDFLAWHYYPPRGESVQDGHIRATEQLVDNSFVISVPLPALRAGWREAKFLSLAALEVAEGYDSSRTLDGNFSTNMLRFDEMAN